MHDWSTLALYQQYMTWKKGRNDPMSLMPRTVLHCSACSRHLSNTYWTNIKQKNIITFSSVEIYFHECISLKFIFAILLVSDLKNIQNFTTKITANEIIIKKVGWGTGSEGINASSLTIKTFVDTEF